MEQEPKHIYICGMPGSGKSTLGRQLANHLGAIFYDLDDLIEKKTGKEVKDIFADDGEAYFREVERSSLIDYIQSPPKTPGILALGGGTPCFFDNMCRIKQAGLSIFLDTPLKVIKNRMLDKDQLLKRPLLAGIDVMEVDRELQRKYDQRISFYSQAHLKIQGDESLQSISSLISSYIAD